MIKKIVLVLMSLVLGCGCQHDLHFPSTSDGDARLVQVLMGETVQMYRIVRAINEKGEKADLVTLGTGVVLKNGGGKSLILTAGHVLATPPPVMVNPLGDNDVRLVLEYEDHVYDLMNNDCALRVLNVSEHPDLALGQSECIAGAPVQLASRPPPVGASILTVGAPHGWHPDRAYDVVDGRYLGYDEDVEKDDAFSIPTTHGFSGSGIFYKGQLVGIVSLADSTFEHLTHGPGILQVLDYIEHANRSPAQAEPADPL
jgi:Trypsin-like peptidase domain